ncbi:MAG: hypothetical protein PHD81_03675 [Candidatus Nanoarchaeia archaeon]|nr:hypothetical protein [Candidatus Nanoarchaeia archaeon]MDD5588182.1 hypothetical protein [Candidatus Nanoarchaeia archaeon]
MAEQIYTGKLGGRVLHGNILNELPKNYSKPDLDTYLIQKFNDLNQKELSFISEAIQGKMIQGNRSYFVLVEGDNLSIQEIHYRGLRYELFNILKENEIKPKDQVALDLIVQKLNGKSKLSKGPHADEIVLSCLIEEMNKGNLKLNEKGVMQVI